MIEKAPKRTPTLVKTAIIAMPPRVTRSVAASIRKNIGTQRTLQPQTISGSEYFRQGFRFVILDLGLIVLKLPLELFFEIFSYLNDHRDFIQGIPHTTGPERTMEKKDVERSTVIRNLTMTCQSLRSVLLPVLWKDVEGCMVFAYPDEGHTYGLFAQCGYLLSNPIVAAYVQCVLWPHENNARIS
jgi:hypothetical protein